jgi:hypothetical protein
MVHNRGHQTRDEAQHLSVHRSILQLLANSFILESPNANAVRIDERGALNSLIRYSWALRRLHLFCLTLTSLNPVNDNRINRPKGHYPR